jgi:hypothetical protein
MQRLVFAIIAVALAYNLAINLDWCSSPDLASLQAAYTGSLQPGSIQSDFTAPASHFIAPGGDDDLACQAAQNAGGEAGQAPAEPGADPAAIAPGGDDDLPLNL